MSKEPKRTPYEEKIEEELDRELEDTFPASDPLDVTRIPHHEEKKTGPAPDKEGMDDDKS